MKFTLKYSLMTSCFVLSTIICSCGQVTSETKFNEELGAQSSSTALEPVNPFKESPETGDDYPWGFFIRGAYQTTSVTQLPIRVYAAFFTPDEEDIVQEAIDIANEAVGYPVFQLSDEWTSTDRVIYKVNTISFASEETDGQDLTNVVGYTFSRNVYINGLKESGRIVTDWAMEIKATHVNKWVIAHELGHAMGIQKHALIDYDHDTTVPLPKNELMAEVISFKPELEDYHYMMQQQGELLLDYMEQI